MATAIDRSGNPALRGIDFDRLGATERPMTIAGTVNKTTALLFLCVGAAIVSWNGILHSEVGSVWRTLPLLGAIGGFIVALVTCFKMTWAPTTAPIYAVLEGLFLGGVSAIMEKFYHGIVIQAVALTFLVFICMLMAYKSGTIKVTKNFVKGIFAATGAICIFYVASFVLGLFGVTALNNLIWSNGWFGIGLSLFVCVIAALNLVLDFAFIEGGEKAGAPQYMEWYFSFSLLVTLVWLYIEILRLLTKLQSQRS